MFDSTKIIRCIWAVDNTTGEDVLVDLDHNVILLRRAKEQIVDPNEKIEEKPC
jgi:hypothetical protein